MNGFKLVVLDNAKEQLNSELAKKVLSDILFVKQKNFLRTDPNYIVLDKHDMIGTHFLIYDTAELYNPKLIFALRMTYEDRALKHKIKTPILDLIPQLEPRFNKHFEEFRKNRPIIADCNSWFVDPDFSKKNSGLSLSDLGYTMAYLQLTRMGFDHFAGCTNEKYKAHRWGLNIGTFSKDFEFIHPVVQDPHMLVLMENFNKSYFKSVYESNSELFHALEEISLMQDKNLKLNQYAESLFKETPKTQLKVAV